MKVKHNKKRNTAFLYEALVRELTKSVVEKNTNRSSKIKSILKEHFRSGKILFGELSCFKALSDEETFDHYTAEKMIFRAKKEYESLDQKAIFMEQSTVIKKINSDLGKEVYNNFVPDYKSYATLAQIFGNKLPVKSRVILEQKILETLTTETSAPEKLQPVDNLVVKSFTNKFNEAYSELLPEQRVLLTRYITSFEENEADFRMFVGEELKRIKTCVEESLSLQEVKEDDQMVEGTNKVLSQLSQIKVHQINEQQILKILKLQQLVREYEDDAHNN